MIIVDDIQNKRVQMLHTMCREIAKQRSFVRRQDVCLKAWGECTVFYVDGLVYLFPLKQTQKCIAVEYGLYCRAVDNGGIVSTATKANTLYVAYHLARDTGRDGIVICLSPNNLPYCNGAVAWRLCVDANNTHGTLNRFCKLTGVVFRDGNWQPTHKAPWIGCQVWSRSCQGLELLYL